jgi:hypothetical protein
MQKYGFFLGFGSNPFEKKYILNRVLDKQSGKIPHTVKCKNEKRNGLYAPFAFLNSEISLSTMPSIIRT